jgi:hypothetical protein
MNGSKDCLHGRNGRSVHGWGLHDGIGLLAWQEWFTCMTGMVYLHDGNGLLAWQEW